MKYVRTIVAVAILTIAASTSPVSAQARTMSAEEQDNLKLVSDWWREVQQAGHVDLAEKYMLEDYLEHNPNINTGRAAFVQAFSRRPVRDIKPALDPAPVIQFAKGPYVAFIWEREGRDPAGAAYKYNAFDLVRVENGKVAEHWDSVFRTAPADGTPVPAVTTGIGQKPVEPRNTAEEQRNEDTAKRMFKDILQYGHLELADAVMAEGYIQHNPNVPTGRAGFINVMKQFAKPEPIQTAWKDAPELTITSGNLVLFMNAHYSAVPGRPDEVYRWDWFDMVRVDGGMVQEHWDVATKPGSVAATPPSVPRPAGFREYR